MKPLVKAILCGSLSLTFIACDHGSGGRTSPPEEKKVEKSTEEKQAQMVKDHDKQMEAIVKMGEPNDSWDKKKRNDFLKAMIAIEKIENSLRKAPYNMLAQDNSVQIHLVRVYLDEVKNKQDKSKIADDALMQAAYAKNSLDAEFQGLDSRINRMNDLLTMMNKAYSKEEGVVMPAEEIQSALTVGQVESLQVMVDAQEQLIVAASANLDKQKEQIAKLKELNPKAAANFDKMTDEINAKQETYKEMEAIFEKSFAEMAEAQNLLSAKKPFSSAVDERAQGSQKLSAKMGVSVTYFISQVQFENEATPIILGETEVDYSGVKTIKELTAE